MKQQLFGVIPPYNSRLSDQAYLFRVSLFFM